MKVFNIEQKEVMKEMHTMCIEGKSIDAVNAPFSTTEYFARLVATRSPEKVGAAYYINRGGSEVITIATILSDGVSLRQITR